MQARMANPWRNNGRSNSNTASYDRSSRERQRLTGDFW
jgi:hypothetical protein